VAVEWLDGVDFDQVVISTVARVQSGCQRSHDPSLPSVQLGARQAIRERAGELYWERAGEYLAALDDDQRLVAGIAGVDVRRWMIDEVHLDDDPIELADPRHDVIVSNLSDGATRLRELPGLGRRASGRPGQFQNCRRQWSRAVS
jgi:hypothetical protein